MHIDGLCKECFNAIKLSKFKSLHFKIAAECCKIHIDPQIMQHTDQQRMRMADFVGSLYSIHLYAKEIFRSITG